MTGEMFRKMLRGIGITQAEFARQVGVTPRAVSYWVSGQRKVPRYAVKMLGVLWKARARAALEDALYSVSPDDVPNVAP